MFLSRRLCGLFILVLLVILALFGFIKVNPPGRQDEATTASQSSPVRPSSLISEPFNLIDTFFRAVTANDWDRVREIVSPGLFTYLEQSGFIARWEKINRMNPNARFEAFVVSGSKIDPHAGTAWAFGEARWTNIGTKGMESKDTFIFRQTEGKWLIVKIDSSSSIEGLDAMYTAINRADWRALKALITPDYWEKLLAGGIIAALVQDRARIPAEDIYVLFVAQDFSQSTAEAVVKGVAIWYPTTTPRETPVTAHLIRAGETWQVCSIQGHWRLTK